MTTLSPIATGPQEPGPATPWEQAAATRRGAVSPEQLLASPYEHGYELVGGHLVEKQIGAESSLIALQIAFLLRTFLRGKRMGHLLGADAGYQCYPDAPGKVRKPDVSFVRAGRLPGEIVPRGHILIPPDLAVEVVSPNDSADEVDNKVGEYLAAGVRLVWVVYPARHHVQIHRPAPAAAGILTGLFEADTIGGEDVIPGFACKVSEFFEQD